MLLVYKSFSYRVDLANGHGLAFPAYNPGFAIQLQIRVILRGTTTSGQVAGDLQFRQNASGSMTPRMRY
jgi:hypothetical protein